MAEGELLPVQPEVAEINATWEECALTLLGESGRKGKSVVKLPALYQKHSRNKTEDFLKHLMSVIYVESRFNKQALSDKEAYGLMQMTAIAVTDAVRHCKLTPVLDMTTLFDSATNIRYGTCYLKKVLDEMEGDWTRTLIVYNGGYRQLTRYEKGETIANETANYVLQVEKALVTCSKPHSKE